MHYDILLYCFLTPLSPVLLESCQLSIKSQCVTYTEAIYLYTLSRFVAVSVNIPEKRLKDMLSLYTVTWLSAVLLFQITTCVLLSIVLPYPFCMRVPEPFHHFPPVYIFKGIIVFDMEGFAGAPWDLESLRDTWLRNRLKHWHFNFILINSRLKTHSAAIKLVQNVKFQVLASFF